MIKCDLELISRAALHRNGFVHIVHISYTYSCDQYTYKNYITQIITVTAVNFLFQFRDFLEEKDFLQALHIFYDNIRYSTTYCN